MSSQLPQATRASRAAGPWTIAALLCSALLTIADATLLEVTRGGFTNGFGSVLLDTTALRARYAATALALNGFVTVLAWMAIAPLLARVVSRTDRILTLSALFVLLIAMWSDVIMYEIHSTIGALITPGVVMELAGNDVTTFNEASAIARIVVIVGALLSALGTGIGLRLGASLLSDVRLPLLERPQLRSFAVAVLALGLASVAALAGTSRAAGEVREALHLQPAAALLRTLINAATDLDFDGSGLLSRPPDGAPFDASIHPFALDIPASGIDEDQIAGDLPAGVLAPTSAPIPAPPGDNDPSRKPHILIVYLESFRFDLLAAEVDGRRVAPFLATLEKEGASSRHAYVHSPYTTRSRGQLFGGTLTPEPGQETWVDDFAARGYLTAHFSGQDDSFGESEALISASRVDRFYDARDDTARRTSRSTAASSLQVSWKLVVQRVRSFLAEIRKDQPLFLYVNVVDTHYPYHHAGLDEILYDDPVDRAGIRSSNREAVWLTYLNAAANVDRAIEELVGNFREAIGGGPHVILVTSDHGQSFYEDGSLGHGRRLDLRQTHVPLIIYGTGGVWPEPIGASDIRGLLLASLEAPRAARPTFVPEPERRVFQYLPNLDRPARLALRGIQDTVLYDFPRGVAVDEDGEVLGSNDAEWTRLIQNWEALRLEGAAH